MKKGDGPIPIETSQGTVTADRPWVKVYVDEGGRVQVRGNAPEHVTLALLCDDAAALAKKIMSDKQPKSSILVPKNAIFKPS